MNLVRIQNILDNAAFADLFLTMLLFWLGLAMPRVKMLQPLAVAGMAIANLGLAVLLLARWLEAGYFPLSNLYESLLFIAWGVTLVGLWFQQQYPKVQDWIGSVTAPVAMGIVAFAALSLPSSMQTAQPLVPALKSNWLMMHVSVMLLSYAALMTGSGLAIAFLWVMRGQAQVAVQGNSLGLVGRGSPSGALGLGDTLDNLSYRAIGLGFPLLTIGIISGGVWANEAWGSYWSWDAKETWSLIVWLVFAAYLHTRITKGWQGKRPAIIASCGFLVVWVCYLGVNLLGKGLHSYGWFF
ncbi:MAG: c-type cytochrome biogenesis protein CcsB [Oscillatoriales cyanobacterium SM2_2_1]|nr:c-type cytochrome biogenesis protein CcsB [Oscillatoriales cyanobacterium SM2_2_1]